MFSSCMSNKCMKLQEYRVLAISFEIISLEEVPIMGYVPIVIELPFPRFHEILVDDVETMIYVMPKKKEPPSL